MLLAESSSPRPRTFAVLTADPARTALLEALLSEWQYTRVPVEECSLMLIERGCTPPAAPARRLWLGGAPEGESSLPSPFSMEELWTRLQQSYEDPPRRHLRIPLETPVRLLCRGEEQLFHLVSLSDYGARFGYSRELPPGEQLSLTILLGGEPYRTRARVIYAFPRAGQPKRAPWEIGVLFEGTDPAWRLGVRSAIIDLCLERISTRLPPDTLARGLATLRLPAMK